MPLKDESEIQEAHDFLHAVIEFDAKTNEMDKEVKTGMHAAHDALCWVLQHKQNAAFDNNLRRLKKLAEDCGIKVIAYKSHPE